MEWVRDISAYLLVLWLGGSAVVAQQDAREQNDGTGSQVKPLAAKQEMLRDRVRRLEDRMFRLRQKLAESEPPSAAKLAKALERMGEAEIDAKVERLIELLADDGWLFQASDLQKELLAELETVLGLLLARSDPDARRQRKELLRQYGREVGQALEEQRELRAEAARSAAATEQARQIADALQRIDRLIEKQNQVRESSEVGLGQGPSGSPQEEQRGLAREARQLAEDVRAIDQERAVQAAADAAQAIESAAGRMQDAAQALEQSDAGAAAEDQDQAIEQLERARHRLQEEARRLENQGQESDSPNAAGRQRRLAGKAGDLSERMKGGRGQSGGQPGGQTVPAQPAPGQQNVAQARQHMQDAAEDLEAENPQQAVRDQDWTVEELEEALEKLEDELHQLRREERQELLGNLESRFVEMLNGQLAVNADTSAIFGRSSQGLVRADRLRVARLADQEADLAEKAATCLHILEEDGTTVVFPQVVGQLSADMRTAAGRLGDLRLGELTQSLEQEIVATLRELIEAVQRLQEAEQQQQPGQAGRMSDEAPLLPGSAELRLLKAAQLRVNQRTAATQRARLAGTEKGEDLIRVLEELTRRQRTVADLARETRDRSE